MEDKDYAKLLLEGHSCNDCFFNIDGYNCNHLSPIEVKYPNDVQVFMGGLLKSEGPDSVVDYIIIDNNVIFNQHTENGGSITNTSDMNFNQEVVIYSRGINSDGQYECQKIKVGLLTHPMPEERVCKYWQKKNN